MTETRDLTARFASFFSGFFFSRTRVSQIFDGEEFSKMIRLWTHGYDVYTPTRSYIAHDYSHPDDNTVSSRASLSLIFCWYPEALSRGFAM